MALAMKALHTAVRVLIECDGAANSLHQCTTSPVDGARSVLINVSVNRSRLTRGANRQYTAIVRLGLFDFAKRSERFLVKNHRVFALFLL